MNKKFLIILFLVLTVAVFVYKSGPDIIRNNHVKWESGVMPGKLSAAHALLTTKCASCHTPAQGVTDVKCISCHATNKALLERQPTAFHAVVSNCATCHTEHRGVNVNMRVMDHEALARIGTKMIGKKKEFVKLTATDQPPSHPLVSALVASLDCASCHSTKDKHAELFGVNCASCHATTQWTIPEFQHPSVRSVECAQCHQAPPSHYMMHFEMVDKKVVAGGTEGKNGCCGTVVVNQCYTCHQTTSWNDIKGVGFYKHH